MIGECVVPNAAIALRVEYRIATLPKMYWRSSDRSQCGGGWHDRRARQPARVMDSPRPWAHVLIRLRPGAVTFERVLAEEVIPWVESHYRAASDRMLWGHSLSGSFAVHVLLNRPELFKAYVAASAPLWRYEGFAADMTAGLPRPARAHAAVYLAVGEYENENLRGGVRRLVDTLKARDSTTAPEWSFFDMKDQDHNSMPMPSLYWALETRYAKWRFPFFETLAELDSLGGLRALENHYERFAKHFGYTAFVPEDRLSSVASIYVAADRHAEMLDLATR